MARLIASLSLAAGLIVALAATAFAQDGSTFVCMEGVKGDQIETIEGIMALDDHERSPEQWRMIAEACAKCLRGDNEIRWFQIRRKAAVGPFEAFKESLGHLSGVKAEDLGVDESWISLLTLREQVLECNDDSRRRVVEEVKRRNGNPWQTNYVLDCFQGYLNKCGYEEQYKKVMENIDVERRSVHKATLGILLESVIWTYSNDRLDYNYKLDQILGVVGEMSHITPTYDEQDCTSWAPRMMLATLLVRSKVTSHLYSLMKDCFAVYLEQCRLEERFKEATTKHGVAVDRGETPLTSYLTGSFIDSMTLLQDRSREIVYALDIVDTLDVKFDCNRKNTDFLYKMRQTARRRLYAKFIKCLDDIFADYLKTCTGAFKAKTRELAEGEKEALSIIKDYGKQLRTKLAAELESHPQPRRTIVENVLKESDFLNDLKRKCADLWESTGTFIEAIAHDSTEALQDAGIKQFINDIGLCFFWRTSPGVSSKVYTMFIRLGSPF